MGGMNASKRKRGEERAFSLKFRFLATVVIAILAVTIFVGGLSLYEVDRYVQKQAEDFVSVMCENEAAKINDSLENMEKSVKIMESYLMDFFPSGTKLTDRALQEKVIQSADQMFVDIAKFTSVSGAAAYYFRFSPAVSDGKAGLFYSKINGSDEFFSFEPTDLSKYEKDDRAHVGWFWEPYEAGKAIWMKPYRNENNWIRTISYVIPMYLDGAFFAIVGMDFDYEVLSRQVHEIQIYEHGFAHLEVDGEVVCTDEHVSGSVEDGKRLSRSKELANGMTLVLSADYEDIQLLRREIVYEILLTVGVLSTLLLVLTVYAVKKIVEPLNHLTEAARKLSDGDYEVEIPSSNTREIRLLGATFETMAARLKKREEELRLSANHDKLTGLRNTTSYAAWVKKFDGEIQEKKADFGVIVFDLNELKETNDCYGHAFGDKLIATAAKVISDVFKRNPVFRIGGDEFLAVLQNSDLENYEKLFTQFSRCCENTFVEEGDVKVPIRIAGGFARFDGEKDRRFADVFKRADDAMYENKSKMKEARNPLPQ